MVIRCDHYRIFKDKEDKIKQMGRWNDTDENIPNMFYDDYLKHVIEPIKKSVALGFNAVSRDYFEKKDKKIRQLSNIGYRLLNFISYSHLFYSFCMGNLSKDKLDKCLIKNCSILKILELDWNLLKEALQEKK